MSRVEVKLPAVPSELKIIAPFTSRAQELSKKDPVIAYYCLYHAIQTGISAKTKEKETKLFLMDMMTALEKMKEQLKEHKEVSNDEAAAKYIENFALKVFTNADNEDRKGGSNRSTAKKFLAASNFFELLSIFDAKYLNPLVQPEEKIKYAKWKAADIAKAYREGRVPQSGPATTVEGSEDELAELQASSHSEIEEASMGSSSGAAGGPFDDHRSAKSQSAKTDSQTDLKPSLPTTESFSSTKTVTAAKNSNTSLPPKHISTQFSTPSPYIVDTTSPSSTINPKTPLRTPGASDGLWSTAATPGIDSPNVFPGGAGGGKPALHSLNPASIAFLNAKMGHNRAGGDSPLSPGPSPKPRSGLGASVFTASTVAAPDTSRKAGDEDGVLTDEEDGWSTVGNPYSRQNSMMPLSSAPSFNVGNAPGLTVTPSLGVLHEEASPNSTPHKARNPSPHASDAKHLVPHSALAAPLPPSASNTAPSSPDARPDSVTFAASHPLPPVLPPSNRSPSSIKSESRALPEDSPNKGYKFTSSIVGDSTSDVEATYKYNRRRANSASGGHTPNNTSKLTVEDKSSSHVRSSSVNAAPILPPSGHASVNDTRRSSASSPEEEDWEKASLSRLARLPDSVSGSDMDSLSGRLRDLGSPNSDSGTPTPMGNGASDNAASDYKSRRNTIKANAPPNPRHSESDFGFTLPGVPSAPPVGDWKNGSGKGGDSDSGGEGDMLAKIPSAPVLPPTIQDQLPHVVVFHKPATPKEELHVNPHFPSAPSDHSTTNNHLESPSTPRNQIHSSTPSSGNHPTTTAPPPTSFGHELSPPPSANSTVHGGHSVPRGYTPPNSVVSPHSNFSITMPPTFVQTHPPNAFAPAAPVNVPSAPSYSYGTNGQTNGVTDAYGLPVHAREPPTELDPETIGKAQKHTKFALSALNFEDLETARNELKKALLLLS